MNRSTIYRRWGSLGAVVGDLASQFASELTYPETGSLNGDLEYATAQIGKVLTPDNCRLVQALLAWRDPAVQTELSAFWSSRKEAIAAILSRHSVRVDVALLVRVMAGPLYYSALIENRSPTRDDVEAAVTATMAWIQAENRRTS